MTLRTRSLPLRILGAALPLAAAGILSACNPCSGIVGCDAAENFAVSGRFIVWPGGEAAPDVRVEILHSGGSTTTRTDADGYFSASWNHDALADSIRLRVEPPPPLRPYVSDAVAVEAISTRGDGVDIGRWLANPFLAYVGEVRDRRGGSIVPGARIQFQRTGGAPLARDRFDLVADRFGRFALVADSASSEVTEGNMTITSPNGQARTFRFRFTIRPRYRDTVLDLDGVLGIGPGFWHYVSFQLRGRGEPKPPPEGTTVEFIRKSGVALSPARIVAKTQPWGAAALLSTPATEGNVLADLVVKMPGPLPPDTIRNLTFRTVDSDVAVPFGTFGVGPSLNYVFEYFPRSQRLPFPRDSIRVAFRRTSGIALDADSFRTAFTPWGSAGFPLRALADGKVAGRIELTFPRGIAPLDLPLELSTFRADSQRVVRLSTGPSLDYIVEVYNRRAGAGVPLRNGRVRFERTGGIPILPDTVEARTNEWGAVSLSPFTTTAGTLIGNLIVEFAPPLQGTDTVRGVEFQTFDSNAQRVVRISTGPSLDYALEIFNRRAGGGEPLRNARVRFERTGGIPVVPDTFEVRTTAWGAVSLATFPLAKGILQGDLIVEFASPRQGADTIRGIELATFESDAQRFLGRRGVGGQIHYHVGIYDLSTRNGVPNAEVRFERTGGIAASPQVLRGRTTSWGAFGLILDTDQEGEVIGNLVVKHPDGSEAVFPGIRVPTFRTDEFRGLGWYGI